MDDEQGPVSADLDDIETYIATFDAEERRRLAIAEVAIAAAIIRHRAAEPHAPSHASVAKSLTPAAGQEQDDIKETLWPPT